MNHYDLSAWAWDQAHLSQPERLLLHGLIHHCRGGKDYCWPSRTRLQTLVGFCSPNEVSRHLSSLKRKNVIEPVQVDRHNGWRILADGCGNPHSNGCRNPHLPGTHTNIGKVSMKNRDPLGHVDNQAGLKTGGEKEMGLKTAGRKGKTGKKFGYAADVVPAGMFERGDMTSVASEFTPSGRTWTRKNAMFLWLSLLGTEFPKETHPKVLNAKDQAMLHQCLNNWAQENVPDGGARSGELLANVMSFWNKFTDEVKFREGVTSIPSRPTIGFMARYKHVAFGLRDVFASLRDKMEPTDTQKGPGGAVQLIAQPRKMGDNTGNSGTTVPEAASKEDVPDHYALDGSKVQKW